MSLNLGLVILGIVLLILGMRKAHPVVPGSPICGTRSGAAVVCGGAQEGIEWLAVIGVSTVPHELKAIELPPACGPNSSAHRKTGNPAPFQNSPASPRC